MGKHLEKREVFKRLQKTGRVCADLMSGGRLFQSRLPAAVKARSPTVTSLVVGISVLGSVFLTTTVKALLTLVHITNLRPIMAYSVEPTCFVLHNLVYKNARLYIMCIVWGR